MDNTVKTTTRTYHRRSGVLLHPSSLPGNQYQGNIGQQAKNFLHFMHDSGLSVWQMLPLGPTHEDGSPYQCLSAHAGNPEMIELDWLVEKGWLNASEIDYLSSIQPQLNRAASQFLEQADETWLSNFDLFTQQAAYWLDDYALYVALREHHEHKSWTEWPRLYRLCDSTTLDTFKRQNIQEIKRIQFTQFIFFTQWKELKSYANNMGIELFGDMPIYVSLDSADAWACKQNFLMDSEGNCDYVAGVPPDAFSDEGQLWGNPLFDWNYLQQHHFSWWMERFKTQFELFDLVRIDHFRGLEACWQIPGNAENAIKGEWVKTPGAELLNCLQQTFGNVPVVAEDLGLITPEVRQLRDDFQLPGMAILQFAFDGQADNLYLPHNQIRNSVVYTGTHDNDTSLGWYQSLADHARQQLSEYTGHSDNHPVDMPWTLNRLALASVAELCILPMQDFLALDSSHRMNTPGTTENNWKWRMKWDQIPAHLPGQLRHLIQLYDRNGAVNQQH